MLYLGYVLISNLEVSFILFFKKEVEFDRPGKRSPELIGLLLLAVTDVSTTCAVVIFGVKVSCITSVDGIILWLLM